MEESAVQCNDEKIEQQTSVIQKIAEMLHVKSTGNGLMTLRSCGQVSAIQVRRSGEHSSCATDSVDRFSGNTETDAGHQGFQNSIEDHPSCAETVPTIQEIQKIVEVPGTVHG